MKKALLSIILTTIFVFSFINCSNNNVVDKDVTISSAGWIYHNVSTSYQHLYWNTDTSITATAYIQFEVHLSNSLLKEDDISSFTATSGDITFDVPSGIFHLVDSSSGGKVLYSSWWYRNNSSSHRIPLGPWTFTVTLNNGNSDSYKTTFSKPGSSTIVANSWAVTEDYGTPGQDDFPMVKRADVTSAEFNSSTGILTVSFSIEDPMARDGWVNILNENREYVGGSNSFLSEGRTFQNNGSNNTYSFDIANYPEISFDINLIHYVYVDIVDGYQYDGTSSEGVYDCMSKSELKQITLQ